MALIRNTATMTDAEVLAELATLDGPDGADHARFYELDRVAYHRGLYAGDDLAAHLARWATASSICPHASA